MRYLLTALLAMALMAPFAWSRITRLPSDDTAGGGSGNIYLSNMWGGKESAWPTSGDCLRVAGGGGSAYLPCLLSSDDTLSSSRVFDGFAYVRKMSCATTEEILWDGTNAEMSWGVYEKTGFPAGAVGYSRNLIGGSLQFTTADEVGVSKSLAINAWSTISNGQLEVGLVSDESGEAASGTVFDSGFHCTVYWIE